MKQLILTIINLYQKTPNFKNPVFSPIFLPGPSCRFSPTCSHYATQAINQYGLLKGGWLSLKRIFRCHPFAKEGFDPLPKL